MIDERPIRCWIHPFLKEELAAWQKMINDVAIKATSYPIQRLDGMPLTSKMCAKILKKIRKSFKNKNFIIKKDKDKVLVELVFDIVGNKKGDKSNLNIELYKIRGIKKNDVTFL